MSYAQALGLESSKGRLTVDDSYLTNVSNIYAIGDVIGLSGSYGAEREGLLWHTVLGRIQSIIRFRIIIFQILCLLIQVRTVGYSSKNLMNWESNMFQLRLFI